MKIHSLYLAVLSNVFSVLVGQATAAATEVYISEDPSSSKAHVDASAWPLCSDVMASSNMTEGQFSCLVTTTEIESDLDTSDATAANFRARCRKDGPDMTVEGAELLCDHRVPEKYTLPPSVASGHCTCEVFLRNEAALAFCNCDPCSPVDGQTKLVCHNRRKKCVNQTKKKGGWVEYKRPSAYISLYNRQGDDAVPIYPQHCG